MIICLKWKVYLPNSIYDIWQATHHVSYLANIQIEKHLIIEEKNFFHSHYEPINEILYLMYMPAA